MKLKTFPTTFVLTTILFISLALLSPSPALAQLTAVSLAPSQVYGAFGTSEGNAGVFFGAKISDAGLYNKTVFTFSGSDSTGVHCTIFRPNCSATSTVVNGFEKIVAQTADGKWTATCDGEGGISASGPNVGFSWGGGCHGWYHIKKTMWFLGFSPRWTKDNVGPNSGKLTFNFDVITGK